MANSNATFGVTLTYVDANGATRTESASSVVAPFQGAEPGQIIDVASGATGGSAHSISFGSVDTEATGVLIKNGCSCPLSVRVGGATGHGVPVAPGGLFLVCNPTSASGATGDGPLLAISCVLGSTQTGGVGKIAAWVFGDNA